MSAVDLSALRMKEQPSGGPPRRPLGPRLMLGALLLLAASIAASFLLPLLTPARKVRTAAVRAAGGAGGATRVTVAEAAGWIEPDPFPVVVRPLVEGVLQELELLEGHAVKRGETVVGRLASAPLLAARDRAAAALAQREAEWAQAAAVREVAESLLDQKADLRLTEARAREEVAADRGRLEAAKGALDGAEAEREARRADLLGQEKLDAAGGSYPVALAKARAAMRAAEAAVAEKAGELAAAAAELAMDEATWAIAREVLADPRALAGEVATARAAEAKARADRDAAKVELSVAERELGWATILAPMDGVVLKLLAAPGTEVGPAGEGVVSLYDPQRLQVRIDVPLASVEGVSLGQEVEVRSEVLPGRPIQGVVIRIQRESDLLKNTLQVKVRLVSPDPLLRPETLCRARFLAPAAGTEGAPGPALFLVPRAALRGGAVFVLDPRGGGRARRVVVEQSGEEGESIVVKGALSLSHRVILDPVEEGMRIEEERP
ncbi:MAG: efflux RND transporter periplasmic adaptor subunit [Planctomycetaceae bacterium]